LPHGIGYGPAEISLRPLLPQPYLDATGTLAFNLNRQEGLGPVDSYATLIAGRTTVGNAAISGKPGYILAQTPARAVTPGTNYLYMAAGAPLFDQAQPDVHAQLKLFGYPLNIMQLSAFGSAPDLMGRYAI